MTFFYSQKVIANPKRGLGPNQVRVYNLLKSGPMNIIQLMEGIGAVDSQALSRVKYAINTLIQRGLIKAVGNKFERNNL